MIQFPQNKCTYLIIPLLVYFFSAPYTWSQSTANFNVEHVENDIGRNGGTNTSVTVPDITLAIELANNNRKTHAGRSNLGAGNLEGDDLSGARVLTAPNTLSYYRQSGSVNTNMRFNTSIWRYTGPSGGGDEFVVVGRYSITLNGGTNSNSQNVAGVITNRNDCIPFITGIMNSDTGNGADSGTALAYIDGSNNLVVEKGTNGNNVTVYVTLVEFTGSNWTVLHGDSGSVSADSGSITLRADSDGTSGTATAVSAWSEAVIFAHFRSDNNNLNTNQAIADLWPRLDPGTDTQTVDWNFHANHDSNGNNRHFTHVLANSGMNVTRFQNTTNSSGEVTIDISSAGLCDVNQAFIVGSTTSSGNGTAYARGWRNYYLNSATQAAHWVHRSGNTISHEIQIVDVSNMYSLDTDGDGIYDVSDLDDDNDGLLDTSELGDTDGDGIIDSLDLDDDNDGIPTVVELNLADADRDASLLGTGWVDTTPNNGVHDSYEGGAATVDSDGDLVPDYLDLDSDNDGVFDAFEYDGLGDVDVSGNGFGSSTSDVYQFYCPLPNNQDGDGISSIIDDNDDGVGNDFGMTTYASPLDSDSDGTPDYRDIDSPDNPNNLGNGSDINSAIFVVDYNDADADGLVFGGSANDADGDGILDDFDTDDVNMGSPRDLDDSFSLFFDGRNDYVEDANVISSGAATLMAWIKSDGSNTSGDNRIALGQSNFFIRINDADNTVSVYLNGSAVLTSTSSITNGIWTHVAATTVSGSTTLYINGVIEGSPTGSGGVSSDTSNFTIGKLSGASSNYFYGELDEIKVFNVALSTDFLQKTVYQELDDTNSFNRGTEIPIDISASFGTNLVRYFKMDGYQDDVLDDKTSATIDLTGATMYNLKQIYRQTAPLPYVTADSGVDDDWTNANNWLHGDVWDITGVQELDISDGYNPIIIRVQDDLDVDTTQSCLGLIIDAGAELTIQPGAGFGQALYNTWFVLLNGVLDLEAESQFIQTPTSFLATSSSGVLERDQQGTANSFTYNYWSSPVSLVNGLSNNVAFNVEDVLFDGTIPDDATRSINFGSGFSHADQAVVPDPIRISSYWLYKFVNTANDYANWQHIGNNSQQLNVTEGFTMKGTSSVGNIDPDVEHQNFVFIGKPNNAPSGSDLVHATFSGSFDANGNPHTTLTGNPFPSAIDARLFISDNISSIGGGSDGITGTLYFWEHWSNNTHVLSDYQGGYATLTAAGGTAATSHPDINQGGAANPNKIPGWFIPVAQGFFVSQQYDDDGMGNWTNPSNGSVIFRNSQRVFEVEQSNTESVFLRQNNLLDEDEPDEQNVGETLIAKKERRMWFKFETPDGYARQLLLAYVKGASDDVDRGFDGKVADELKTDVFFALEDKKYVIQALGKFDQQKEIPLHIKVHETNDLGLFKLTIDKLENVEMHLPIYLKDNSTGQLQDLRKEAAQFRLDAGEHTDRYSIVFENSSVLSVEEITSSEENFLVRMNQLERQIYISNLEALPIEGIKLYNTLGQQIQSWNKDLSDREIQLTVPIIQTGIYILQIESGSKTIARKLFIE